MRSMRWLAGAAVLFATLAIPPAAQAEEPTVERVTVESFDGTELGGWVIRPAGTGKAKLPTILISTPYIAQCVRTYSPGAPCWGTPETPADWAQHPEPVEHLLETGYAVGWFSVRGTGVSGGCFELMGRGEQRDHAVLVDWLAAQPWSNGRVGAIGLSYSSATALEAAVERPRALKTIVVSGVLGDAYGFLHTPQGLSLGWNYTFDDGRYTADVSLTPAGAGAAHPVAVERAPHYAERLCPDVLQVMSEGGGGALTGRRDAKHWKERRLSDRYPRIRASVLIAQGMQDLWQSGHKMQDDAMWAQIRAPKAMFVGQWEHSFPWQHAEGPWPIRQDLRDEWLQTLDSWLAHYLKGGPKPRLVDRARFEDDGGTWHESKRWPPREARDEVLYLGPEQKLAPAAPGAESALPFRSYPQAERTSVQEGFMCPARLDGALGPAAQTFLTTPVQKRTVIAGNPMAYLDLKSDQAGGGFQVLLYDIGPEFDCATATSQGMSKGVRPLSIGGADLRFHHGGFTARPFSKGHVRVDIANLAAVLEPGHRLGISIGYGDPIEYAEVGHTPRIEIGTGPRADSSQLVIPVLEGGFGGREPRVHYPPRP